MQIIRHESNKQQGAARNTGIHACLLYTSYEQYRVRGNFNKVLANIKRLNYYKQKYNSQRPYLSWQFIIFGHNEHEIPLIKKLCEELGLKFNPKLNYSQFSPVRDKDFVRAESGLGAVSYTHLESLSVFI